MVEGESQQGIRGGGDLGNAGCWHSIPEGVRHALCARSLSWGRSGDAGFGGHIEMMFIQAAVALPQVRESAIKAYAVMARSRFAAAPNIPPVDEAGLPSLYISGWFGLYAPKGTPRAVID